jgi:hypothetical protein
LEYIIDVLEVQIMRDMQSTATVAAVDESEEMESVPILDFCASPNKIIEQIRRAGQLVLTNDDGPVAREIPLRADCQI